MCIRMSGFDLQCSSPVLQPSGQMVPMITHEQYLVRPQGCQAKNCLVRVGATSPETSIPKNQHRRISHILYTALIWSAENLAFQPSWRVFVLLYI